MVTFQCVVNPPPDLPYSPAQNIHFLIQGAHLIIPGSYVQLERIPNVGTFLQVLHVAVQAAQCRSHGEHPVLQFTEVQGVELLQLICDSK